MYRPVSAFQECFFPISNLNRRVGLVPRLDIRCGLNLDRAAPVIDTRGVDSSSGPDITRSATPAKHSASVGWLVLQWRSGEAHFQETTTLWPSSQGTVPSAQHISLMITQGLPLEIPHDQAIFLEGHERFDILIRPCAESSGPLLPR